MKEGKIYAAMPCMRQDRTPQHPKPSHSSITLKSMLLLIMFLVVGNVGVWGINVYNKLGITLDDTKVGANATWNSSTLSWEIVDHGTYYIQANLPSNIGECEGFYLRTSGHEGTSYQIRFLYGESNEEYTYAFYSNENSIIKFTDFKHYGSTPFAGSPSSL